MDGSLVEVTTTTLAAGPRLGVNFPITGALSFYPRAMLGVEWVQRNETLVSGNTLSVGSSTTGAASSNQTGLTVSLFAPLLMHPKPHLFFGVGPSVFHEFARASGGPDVGGQRTTISARFVVGGDLGGPKEFPNGEPIVETTRAFGDEGQVVFMGDFAASGYYSIYEGTGISSGTLSFTPSVDYFVLPEVSIGIGVGGAYSTYDSIDASNGARVTFTNSSAYLVPRIGYDLHLAPWLSWYWQASLGLGRQSQNATELAKETDISVFTVTASLYAPFLVHAVPHFFLGLGPEVSHDLVRSPSSSNVQNRSTTFGAAFTVGGWL